MTVPHDHHFIPAFYLRQWCDPQTNKLVEYSIPHGRKVVSKLVGPRATGYERDLYAAPELPPNEAQWMEQQFFDYADRTASEALDLLLGDIPKLLWADQQVSAWARFLVGIHLRHPDAITELKAHARTRLERDAEERWRELPGAPGGPETFAEWVATKDPNLPYRFTLELMMGAIDNEFICEHLMHMQWAVIDVSQTPRRFVTSDRPAPFHRCKEPQGSVTIPISPTKLFVAVNDPRLIEKARRIKHRHLVDKINEDNVRRARRFVWGLRGSSWQRDRGGRARLPLVGVVRRIEEPKLLPLI
jgi:hypothetical protein